MRLGLGTNVFHQTIIVVGPLLLLSMEKDKVKWNFKWKPADITVTHPTLLFSVFNVSCFYKPQIGVKYLLTSWANSTFCSSSLSSVCLALLSSNSSLFSVSTFFLSASAWISSFCSISVRRFCCGGESRRRRETALRISSQASNNYSTECINKIFFGLLSWNHTLPEVTNIKWHSTLQNAEIIQ